MWETERSIVRWQKLHSHEYTTKKKSSDVAARKNLFQMFLYICTLLNDHDYNGIMLTFLENYSRLEVILNDYSTVLKICKMLLKGMKGSILSWNLRSLLVPPQQT